jgi:ABC-type sugar transport system substrate-binding protein
VVDVSKNSAGALKAYLVAHPNVDAIFTLGSGATGSGMARQVIAELKRGSKIALVSTDYDPSDLKAIANGTQLAAITQEQYLESYLAAAVTRVYFERGQVPAFISTGPRVVDKTNIKTVIANVAKGLR